MIIKTSLFVCVLVLLTGTNAHAAASFPNVEALTPQDVADHVHGCGTLVARTADYHPRPEKTENWVFFDDWKHAYIRVNGQLVTLSPKNAPQVTNHKALEGLKIYKVFKSQTPKLTVDLSLIMTKVIGGHETDSLAFVKGTLKISDGIQTIILPVSGEEGC